MQWWAPGEGPADNQGFWFVALDDRGTAITWHACGLSCPCVFARGWFCGTASFLQHVLLHSPTVRPFGKKWISSRRSSCSSSGTRYLQKAKYIDNTERKGLGIWGRTSSLLQTTSHSWRKVSELDTSQFTSRQQNLSC